MKRAIVELFYAVDWLPGLCFGPLMLAIVLIATYYLILLYLKLRSDTENPKVEHYKSLAGRWIYRITILPVFLVPLYFILEYTIIASWTTSYLIEDRERLVHAIEDYKVASGNYPETLDKLISTEFPEIPKMPWGVSYYYETSGDWYALSYVYSFIGPVFCRYGSGSLGWYCD